jgi:hypothetical protein
MRGEGVNPELLGRTKVASEDSPETHYLTARFVRGIERGAVQA